MSELAGSALFDAVLTPHRSLTARGFTRVMWLLGGLSALVGTIFLLHGAWPVLGFFGLDVLLVYWAFKANYRAARAREIVTLTDADLFVRRVDAAGRERAIRLEPAWLRVEIDEPPEHHSPLTLCSEGRRVEIGAFLTAPERLDLARALRAALVDRRRALIAREP